MVRKYKKSLAICFKASAFLVSLSSGYGRAFAGTCAGTGGSYLCSGATAPGSDATIFKNIAGPLTVTTSPGFGIDTTSSGGDAFHLAVTTTGPLTFTDNNASIITGNLNGISARNLGTGALSITASGQVTGDNRGGIFAVNLGTDLKISTASAKGNNYGIEAINLGTGALSITTSGLVQGTRGVGVFAINYGTDLKISAADVYGKQYGIVAINNGTGVLSITASGQVTGNSRDGISAYNYGTGLTISTAGVSGDRNGISAYNSGTGVLSITANGQVTGNTGYGIRAFSDGGPTTINVAASSVVKGGTAGLLVMSFTGQPATINIAGQVSNLSLSPTDLAITTSGAPTTVNLLPGSTTTGKVALGGFARLEGFALFGFRPRGVGNNVVNWTGGTLNGSIDMLGSNNTVNITGVPSANLTQVYHLNGDFADSSTGQVLNLSNIQYKGGTFSGDDLTKGINLNNWDTINLTNGTQWTLTGNLTLKDATVNIDATSTLYAGNGVNPVISAATPVTVDNAGTIDLTNGGFTATNKLTILGNYVGEDGLLKLNTVLGPGTPASDHLVIDGSNGGGAATGHTRILVNPIGISAATTGDGIKLVDAVNGATIAPGAFILSRPTVGGAYADALFQGGPNATDVYGDSYTSYDYYLRTTHTLSASAQTYRAYPASLLALDAETMGTLQQRTGNRVWEQNGQQNISGTGAWVKVGGSTSSLSPTTGTDYTQDNGFIQGGYDRSFMENATGHFIIGGFGTLSGSTAKMQLGTDPGTLTSQTGSIRTAGYGLGANVTWLGKNGTYIDGVVQATWFNSDIAVSDLTQNVSDNQGFGSALGVEGGHRISLDKNWAVVPQAQLVYSAVTFNGITDSYGVHTNLQDGDSLLGRVGARLERFSDNPEASRRTQTYMIANLSREFLNGTKVDVAGTSLKQENNSLWGELGLGMTVAISEKWNLYVEGSYNTSLDHVGDSYIAKGAMGVSTTF